MCCHLQQIIAIKLLISILAYSQDKCLGEFEYCPINNGGVCAIDCTNARLCKEGQYVCPISKTCINSVDQYINCPQLVGTHLDWNLTVEQRIDFLINNLTLNEKYPQLSYKAPAINRLGIPFYSYRSNDIHTVDGQSHATIFPDGCGMGATWSKQDIRKIAYIIGFEQRSLHNSLVHEGNRDPKDGGSITNNGPCINLVRDPRWGRNQEVYSEDPKLTSSLGYEFVQGMQFGGLQNDKYLMVATQCKHLAGFDMKYEDHPRAKMNANIDAVNWAETYSPVFRNCVIEAKAVEVMCSYNSINWIPACANNYTMNTILRNKWGFQGFVVSDYDAMEQIFSVHHYVNTSKEAVSVALKAGCDMEGGGNTAINTIPKAINDGLLTIDDVNRALKRIMRVRILLGLFDPPTFVQYNEWYNSSEIEGEAHLNYSRLIASKSICLYKNDKNVLPLWNKNDIKGIALIGPQSISTDLLLGSWSSYPTKGVTTIIGAMREEMENIIPTTNCTFMYNISYEIDQVSDIQMMTFSAEECCNLCFEADNCNFWTFSQSNSVCWLKETVDNTKYENITHYISGKCLNKHIITNSKIHYSLGCDTVQCLTTNKFNAALNLIRNMYTSNNLSHVLIGLGLDQLIESGNLFGDRLNIELPQNQYNLVSFIYNYTSNRNIPIICYLIHGGSVALQNVYNECEVILDVWYPGQMGGYALTDVLFGHYNPAGRASVTYYTSTDILPPIENMNEYNMNGFNGITYRYFNQSINGIVIPFGFGLSYTQFKYSDLSLNISKNDNSDGYILYDPCGVIKISFNVTNVGRFIGDEVVQLYVKQVHATVPVPNIRLGDFERINLIQINETLNVNLILTPRYRSSVFNHTSKIWYEPDIQIEKGVIKLYIGGSQPNNETVGKYSYLETSVMINASTSFYDCVNQT
eukprot:550832_1